MIITRPRLIILGSAFITAAALSVLFSVFIEEKGFWDWGTLGTPSVILAMGLFCIYGRPE